MEDLVISHCDASLIKGLRGVVALWSGKIYSKIPERATGLRWGRMICGLNRIKFKSFKDPTRDSYLLCDVDNRNRNFCLLGKFSKKCLLENPNHHKSTSGKISNELHSSASFGMICIIGGNKQICYN